MTNWLTVPILMVVILRLMILKFLLIFVSKFLSLSLLYLSFPSSSFLFSLSLFPLFLSFPSSSFDLGHYFNKKNFLKFCQNEGNKFWFQFKKRGTKFFWRIYL